MTYAELEAEATWVARRLAAHGVRRGSTAALTMHPRREQVVLAHALMKVGGRLLAAEPAADRGRAGRDRRRRGADRRPRRRRRADPDRGRPAAAGRARHGRDLRPRPHQRQHRHAAPGRPHLRQLPLERGRLRLQHRRRSRGPLALLPAAEPHRRARDRHALGHLRDHRGRPRRLRRRPRRRRAGMRRHHRGLGGGDDADPPARGRRRPLRPAGDPGRRRPGARGAAGRGDRQGRDRGPDLRPDRDLLAGDDPGPGRRQAQARLRRAAAADHPPADRGRRDPRPGADRRPRRAPTPTAGCTPATSATSTRRASSTSRTGSTT